MLATALTFKGERPVNDQPNHSSNPLTLTFLTFYTNALEGRFKKSS